VLAQLLYVLYSMIEFYEISPLDKAHNVNARSVLMDVEDNNNVTSYFQVQNVYKDTV